MGVYQRYKDQNGKPTGQWFIRYPDRRNQSGEIVYKRAKVGDSKLVAKRLLAKKVAEFTARDATDNWFSSDLTFDRLIDWYLVHPKAKSKKSFDKDVQRSRVLREHFGHLRITKIKPSMIEEYQQKRLGDISMRKLPLRPATVNREFALMRRMFNLAKRDGLVEKNPCDYVTALPERNKRDRILTRDEYKRLLEELREPVKSIVTFAYYTGMRKSEILNLTWDRVNLVEGYVDLGHGDTKTGEKRRIFLNDELKHILMNANKVRNISHQYVFTRKNGHKVKDIREAFLLACKRAGIENFVFHDLRHTFNTNMRKAGVNHTVVMNITGHKTTEMFLRYNTVDDYDSQEAIRLLDEYLQNEGSLCKKKSGTKVTHWDV